MSDRPTRERIERARRIVKRGARLSVQEAADLLAEIDALRRERDEAIVQATKDAVRVVADSLDALKADAAVLVEECEAWRLTTAAIERSTGKATPMGGMLIAAMRATDASGALERHRRNP